MNKVLFFAHLRDAVGQESIEYRRKWDHRFGIKTADV